MRKSEKNILKNNTFFDSEVILILRAAIKVVKSSAV